MLTGKAKLLITILGICLILAWLTQIEFIYLICAILAGVLLLSFLFFQLTLINVSCTRQMPNAAYEEETIKIKVTIESQGIFANYLIYLSDNFTAEFAYKQKKTVLLPYLPKRATVNWTYKGLCFERGIYWVGPFTLIASDPLGLFKKYKIINTFSKLTVYPRVFDIHYLPSFTKNMVTPRYGPHASRRSGEYEEFYGIREYRQEDGLRKIHWLSTAKHNKLIVRHFEQSGINAITIILDLKRENNLGFGKESTLEYAIKIAASLSRYFLNQGCVVQFLAYAGKPLISSFGQDPSHFFTILELLTQAQSNGYYSLGQALTMLNSFIPPTSTLAVIRLDSDLEVPYVLKQLVYAKNISIIEIQLATSTFDKYAPKSDEYNIQIKNSDIQTYRISCGTNLENSFNPI